MSIYPTLCELSGLPKPAHIEGVSLTGLLKTPDKEWPHAAITTFKQNNHAVRTDRWRYIRYADGSEELYDHQNDPLEWTNLALRPDTVEQRRILAAFLPTTNVPDAEQKQKNSSEKTVPRRKTGTKKKGQPKLPENSTVSWSGSRNTAITTALRTSEQSADDTPPNVVWLIVEDMSADFSCYGQRDISTPNVDRLAAEGTRFSRAFVTAPICSICRSALITGRYQQRYHLEEALSGPRTRDADTGLPAAPTSLPRLVKNQGYATALIGKWHLGSDPTGFNHWEILPGQGIYYNPPMRTAAGKTQHRGYVTDVIADLSLEWLAKRDRTKPFLLMSQHKAPHREWAPPLRHLGWDGDRTHAEPPTLFDDYAGRSRAVSDHDMGIDRTLKRMAVLALASTSTFASVFIPGLLHRFLPCMQNARANSVPC